MVEIRWKDATSDNSSYSLADIKSKKPYICNRKTLGYYLFRADGFIICCSDITIDFGGNNNDYSDLLTFPDEMIKDIKVIKSFEK